MLTYANHALPLLSKKIHPSYPILALAKDFASKVQTVGFRIEMRNYVSSCGRDHPSLQHGPLWGAYWGSFLEVGLNFR